VIQPRTALRHVARPLHWASARNMVTTRHATLYATLLATSMAACGARQQTPATAATGREPVMDPFTDAAAPPAPTTAPSRCQLAPVYFAIDSSQLDGTARDKLWQDTRCIRERKLPNVRVVGMTDPRGTEEYNLALGERRARAASDFIRAMGLDATLQPTSLGEERATGSEEAGWAADRRVDLVAEQ
jgi:peptidoglycan-associated lipoprotein